MDTTNDTVVVNIGVVATTYYSQAHVDQVTAQAVANAVANVQSAQDAIDAGIQPGQTINTVTS